MDILSGYESTESSRGVQMSTKLLIEQEQVGQVAEIWGDPEWAPQNGRARQQWENDHCYAMALLSPAPLT